VFSYVYSKDKSKSKKLFHGGTLFGWLCLVAGVDFLGEKNTIG